MKYKVKVKDFGKGLRAFCPSLPGCSVHVGNDLKEAELQMQKAIVNYLHSFDVADGDVTVEMEEHAPVA